MFMGWRLKNLMANFYFVLSLFAGVCFFSTPFSASAESKDATTNAIAMHGQPKYQTGFAHFDYVNPAAPKGGSIRYGAFGSFDSFNGFIIKGEAADGLGILYDTLMRASADEAFSRYGLLARAIEMPEDRSWITFYMRPEARWHDGKPITSADVVW